MNHSADAEDEDVEPRVVLEVHEPGGDQEGLGEGHRHGDAMDKAERRTPMLGSELDTALRDCTVRTSRRPQRPCR